MSKPEITYSVRYPHFLMGKHIVYEESEHKTIEEAIEFSQGFGKDFQEEWNRYYNSNKCKPPRIFKVVRTEIDASEYDCG